MLGERQAASILAVAAMLHSGRNNNFYISDIFYFLVYQKKKKMNVNKTECENQYWPRVC